MSVNEIIKTLGSSGMVIVVGLLTGVVLVHILVNYMTLRDDKLANALEKNTTAIYTLANKFDRFTEPRLAKLPP